MSDQPLNLHLAKLKLERKLAAGMREDKRLINFIFDHWFYLSPFNSTFQLPAPGYCKFVEFSDEEIEQLRKEHDDR